MALEFSEVTFKRDLNREVAELLRAISKRMSWSETLLSYAYCNALYLCIAFGPVGLILIWSVLKRDWALMAWTMDWLPAIAIISMVVFMLWPRQVMAMRNKHLVNANPVYETPTTLSLGEEHITVRAQGWSQTVTWSALRRCYLRKNDVVALFAGTALVIPETSFASSEHRTAFLERLVSGLPPDRAETARKDLRLPR